MSITTRPYVWGVQKTRYTSLHNISLAHTDLYSEIWFNLYRSRFKCSNYGLPFIPQIKGEVQYRITIISKERVQYFPTDCCKNYENRIRNKEVVTFWNFNFFSENIAWPVLMNIQMSELVMSRLTICHIYYTWNFENFHFFSQIQVKTYSCIKMISE